MKIDNEGVPAPLGRAILVIEIVASSKEGMTLKSIGERANLPASTTHRVVNSLVAMDYLAIDSREKTYHVGRRLMRLMHTIFGTRNIQDVTESVLSRLMRTFDQVFYVNQLVMDKVRLVAFSMPEVKERALIVPGEYSPINATASGKVIFAFQDEATISRELARPLHKVTPNTISDPDLLREELRRVRELGYAVSNSEFDMGVTAIAVPIDIPNVGVIFSVAVTGLRHQLLERHSVEDYVLALQEAATEMRPLLSFAIKTTPEAGSKRTIEAILSA